MATKKPFWDELRDIGWLDYLPPEQRESRKAEYDAMLQDPETKESAYLALCQYDCDSEDPDYKELLEGLAKASYGRFQSEKIQVRRVRKMVHISFLHGGKEYSCEVEDSGWLETEVLEMVNHAIADTGDEREFIPLPEMCQTMYLVFMPEKTFAKAEKKKLIPTYSQLADKAANFLAAELEALEEVVGSEAIEGILQEFTRKMVPEPPPKKKARKKKP